MAKRTKSKSRGGKNRKPDIRERVSPQPAVDRVESPFEEIESLDNDKMFIECPGVTVYDSQTREVIAGVEFLDEQDPDAGYRIIGQPVYAPEHRRRRLIKKAHRGLIRRCQACQDLTVRLIRREGPDFYIPSARHPHRRQLKPVEKSW